MYGKISYSLTEIDIFNCGNGNGDKIHGGKRKWTPKKGWKSGNGYPGTPPILCCVRKKTIPYNKTPHHARPHNTTHHNAQHTTRHTIVNYDQPINTWS